MESFSSATACSKGITSASLKNAVCMIMLMRPAKADFHGDLHRVHVVELDALAGEGALHGSGQFTAEVFNGVPFGVQTRTRRLP